MAVTQMAQAATVKTVNLAIAISPRPAAKDTNERNSGMNRPKNTKGSPAPGEPGVGTVEILVGEQDVLPDLVDQGPAAVAPDAVAGQGAQHLAQQPPR